MRILKNFFLSLLMIAVCATGYLYRDNIVNYVEDKIYIQKIEEKTKNVYFRNYDFAYLQNTDNFYPNNKQELYNTFYTIINSGWEEFTFYCGKDYTTCIQDVEELSDNNKTLSNFNNYVHPYNAYSSMNINYTNSGRVSVKIEKLYSMDDINKINAAIDKIYSEIIKDSMSTREKVKTIHDYIINHTRYDSEKVKLSSDEDKIIKYKYDSNKATGPILYGYAICGGYTDLMQLFLEKLEIKNYKITTDNHIWNYIYIDNTWKHLDLTWDDPVTSNGSDLLIDTFFLIDKDTLLKLDSKEHNYDTSIFGND